MKPKPTLHDVCAAASVSTYTASRALNGGRGVSEATRVRVQEAAARIGYVPNLHARNLKSPNSTVVAVLTANISNQYYSVLINSLEGALEGEGFDCVAMDVMRDGEYSKAREDRFVASIMAQRVAAVVVTYSLTDQSIAALTGWGLPLIFVDCPAPPGFDQYSSVVSDSYQGSYDLGMHLAAHGYKRWAFVGHTRTWTTRRPREAGFVDAAKAAETAVTVIEGQNSSEKARTAVEGHLLETPRKNWPDVIYASNTVLLHGVFEALRARRLRIPHDIAVVAFDDFDWAEMLDPPITVVDQNIAAIGKAAGRILSRRIRSNQEAKGEELVLTPTLRVRRSCGCGFIRQ